MTKSNSEFDRLERQIAQAGSETRFRYEPQLRRLIARLSAEGKAVPEAAKSLHEALLCEAIEAQFDNMPV
ncbi:MAG: hypothetical protein RQ750_15210 [Roseovarius sp.]|nr:hypothetical protein [Roseovarius sp.]